jgi:hypothetical protein
MKSDDTPKPPLIPKLVLGGFAILLLSWLAFMVHYVRKAANRPAGGEPPPRVMPADVSGAGARR